MNRQRKRAIIASLLTTGSSVGNLLAKVLIFNTGQSNTPGNHSDAPPINLVDEFPHVKIMGKKFNGVYHNTFTTLEYPLPDGLGNLFGFELSYANNTTIETNIVRAYRGGSSIEILSKGHVFNVYNDAITALNDSLAQEDDYLLKIWNFNQWQGDSTTTTEAYKNFYIQMKADFETDSGITFDYMIVIKPKPTVVNGELRTYDNIIQAQIELKAIYGDKYIILDFDDIPLRDEFHYTGAGNVTIGERIATTVNNLIN